MLSDYTHAESPKPPPEAPVRVSLKSQLMAALRQRARPIVIEDPDLALPFTRMLQARELGLRSVGGLVAEAMSYVLSQYYGADLDANWYIGQYVLPGNVQQSHPKAEGSSASYARLRRVGALVAAIPPIAPAFYHSDTPL